MKTFKFLPTFFAFLFACNTAFAASTRSGDSGGGGTAGGNTGKTTATVNEGANTTQKDNKSGQGLAMVMGAGLTAAGVFQIYKQNYMMGALLIGMGVLSFMQSKEHGNVAAAAGETAELSGSEGGAPGEVPEMPKMPDMTPTERLAMDSFKGSIKKLEAATGTPVKANLKTGTVSVDGKTYPASAFASPASMQAAGFSPGDVAQAMAAAEKAEKAAADRLKSAHTATNGFEEGGGGGGGGAIVEEDPTAVAGGAGAGGAGADAGLGLGERDPAAMAGMTKDFNGEPIGVASDSIFLMMNRRYILKDKQNAFINENDLLMQQK